MQRAVRGIDVNDETLSMDVIDQAVHGPDHYFGSAQTLKLMQTESLYPVVGDPRTPDERESDGVVRAAELPLQVRTGLQPSNNSSIILS